MIKKIAIIFIFFLSFVSSANAQYIGTYYGDALFSTNSGPVWIRNVNGTGASVGKIAGISPATSAGASVVNSAAEVTVKNAAGTMAKAGLLSKIGKVAGGGLIAGMALGGAFVLGEMAIDYLLAQGNPDDQLHKKDGYIYRYDDELVPNEYPCAEEGCPLISGTCYANIDEASAATSAMAGAACNNGVIGGNYGWCAQGGPNCSHFRSFCLQGPKNGGQNCWKAMYGTCDFGATPQKVEAPATKVDLEEAAGNGYQANPVIWQNQLIDAVNKLSASITYADSPLRNNPKVNYPDLMSGYLNTLEEEPLLELQKLIDPVENPTGTGTMTPEDIIKQSDIDQERLTQGTPKPTTGEDVIDKATENALNEILNPLGALDPTVDVEEKGTIEPIIDAFISGLGQLPVVSFFTGLKNVGFSGDCNVSLSMPNPFTNTVTEKNLSFCPYETTFNFMGSCLLMLCGITWLFYLFEG